jgi:hypothetical protein
MRIEIVLFLITAFIIANIYTDGKYLKMALSWKKYYQMAGVALGALFIYWVLKKNPLHAKNILMTSNDYLKYMPVDRNTSNILSPILDFTSKHSFSNGNEEYPIVHVPGPNDRSIDKMMNSGKKATKRSVSETKKKFVASRQGWKCGDCGEQLNAWFEVDHKQRLEYGGSNHIDNLLALCRECHGKKTTIENL